MNNLTAYDVERVARRNAVGVGGIVAIAGILFLFLFFLRADLTWSMFMVLGLLAVLFIGISLSYAPKATLLGIVFTKPLLDQLWWFKAFGGLNFQAVVGGFVPVVAFAFLFLTRNEFFLRAPMCIWVRRLCILAFITLWMNGYRGSALAETFRIISGPALFFLTGWLFTSGDDFRRLGKAVVWSSMWIFIGIWVSFAIGKEEFSADTFGENALAGMYYHKHDLARVSMMMCIFSLCFVKMTQSKLAKVLCYLVAVGSGVIVFLSYTRMSWIAMFLCVCFWFMWIGKWKQTLLIAPIVLALSWGTLETAFGKAHVSSEKSLTDDKSVSGRGGIWKAQVKGFINSNPAIQLLGGGFMYSNHHSATYATGLHEANDAHGMYFYMLVESGLIFTIIYNVILLRLCGDAWKLRKSGDPSLTILGALFFVGAAYFYLSGLTTNSHTYPSLTWYVWGLGGIVYRVSHFPDKPGEEPVREHRFFSRSFAPVSLVRPRT